MSRERRHWLTRLYPRSWRERYGDEMDDMLRRGFGCRDAFDVAKAALIGRLFIPQEQELRPCKLMPEALQYSCVSRAR